MSGEFGFKEWKVQYGQVQPLFLIIEEGALRVFTVEESIKPQAGQILVSLALPREEPEELAAATAQATP
ncbi:MAG: hypothetical protein ABS89_01885 [Thiobacillus sp. SCN 63-1177]|nr:MAG: hypothetical protein ABS89_01885 [Thiobacillus sp. SCN 63-1177]